jgi:hypothetical protein
MASVRQAGKQAAPAGLASWHRSLTPRERVYVAFELSETAAELARKGAASKAK